MDVRTNDTKNVSTIRVKRNIVDTNCLLFLFINFRENFFHHINSFLIAINIDLIKLMFLLTVELFATSS